MKKISLFSLVLAAGLFAACSDSVESVGDNTPGTGASKDGYLALSINLPSTSGNNGSRAATYDEGTPNEYNVKSAKLLIFNGNSESTATLVGKYDLTNMSWSTDDREQVTTKSIAVAQVSGLPTSNLYALVLLNDDATKFADAISTGDNLSKLNASSQTGDMDALVGADTDAFFMSNSPFSSEVGGSLTSAPSAPTVNTLVPIDASDIYTTQTQAMQNPAADIYVERAVAKVTLAASSISSEYGNSLITNVTVDAWALDNTNTVLYPVRNVTGVDTDWYAYQHVTGSTNYGYRFLDAAKIANTDYARIHFGVDPNYSVDNEGGSPFLTSITEDDVTMGTDAIAYCMENTFDVERMKWKNTTRAIVKTTLKVTGADEDGTFYTMNNLKNVVYSSTTLNTYVAAIANQWVIDNIDTYIENSTTSGSYTLGDNTSVTFNEPTAGGKVSGISAVSVDLTSTSWKTPAGGGAAYTVADVNKACLDAIAAQVAGLSIVKYDKGVSYYQVRIKHFGDAETPWSVDVVTDPANTNHDTYYAGSSTAASQWLGRYGVLRNTWYDINVTSVLDIGDATIPTAGDQWDDVYQEYIAVQIYIQDWAKRTQDAVLGE